MKALVLILSEERGIYIPRDFVCDAYNEIATEHCKAWGIKTGDAEILQNPDNEGYWDTWNDVLNYAEYNHNGDFYRLIHYGDLWAYCLEKNDQGRKREFCF